MPAHIRSALTQTQLTDSDRQGPAGAGDLAGHLSVRASRAPAPPQRHRAFVERIAGKAIAQLFGGARPREHQSLEGLFSVLWLLADFARGDTQSARPNRRALWSTQCSPSSDAFTKLPNMLFGSRQVIAIGPHSCYWLKRLLPRINGLRILSRTACRTKPEMVQPLWFSLREPAKRPHPCRGECASRCIVCIIVPMDVSRRPRL